MADLAWFLDLLAVPVAAGLAWTAAQWWRINRRARRGRRQM